jgi:hypothetical protein
MNQNDFNFMREALMLISLLAQLGQPYSIHYDEAEKKIRLKGPRGNSCEILDSQASRDVILTILRSEQQKAFQSK